MTNSFDVQARGSLYIRDYFMEESRTWILRLSEWLERSSRRTKRLKYPIKVVLLDNIFFVWVLNKETYTTNKSPNQIEIIRQSVHVMMKNEWNKFFQMNQLVSTNDHRLTFEQNLNLIDSNWVSTSMILTWIYPNVICCGIKRSIIGICGFMPAYRDYEHCLEMTRLLIHTWQQSVWWASLEQLCRLHSVTWYSKGWLGISAY